MIKIVRKVIEILIFFFFIIIVTFQEKQSIQLSLNVKNRSYH